MPATDARDWVARAVAGERRALGRVCRLLEEAQPDIREALYASPVGEGWVVGVTGSPGAGKSSLVAALVSELRKHHERVGVVAVDPSSPLSGGALLGDRIRMQRHTEDEGVFIRSAATRGVLGGLSRVSSDLVRALRVWGAGCVLVETVGVGQDEFDISALADTTCVVFAPGQGDDVQANKAGLIEVADVLVVNKSDLPGAAQAVSDLQGMLSLAAPSRGARAFRSVGHGHTGHGHAGHGHAGHGHAGHGHAGVSVFEPSRPTTDARVDGPWEQRVVSTCARDSSGVVELLDTLQQHRAWLTGPHGQSERVRRTTRAAERRVELAVLDLVRERGAANLERLAVDVAREVSTPDQAADELLELLRGHDD